jgi:hypothetical protein
MNIETDEGRALRAALADSDALVECMSDRTRIALDVMRALDAAGWTLTRKPDPFAGDLWKRLRIRSEVSTGNPYRDPYRIEKWDGGVRLNFGHNIMFVPEGALLATEYPDLFLTTSGVIEWPNYGKDNVHTLLPAIQEEPEPEQPDWQERVTAIERWLTDHDRDTCRGDADECRLSPRYHDHG